MRTAIAALDHLVLATPDLAATVAWLPDATGIRPSAGGPHTNRGTRNALCSFGHASYLELIGPDSEQPEPTHPRPFGVDDLAAPAMVGWAIAVSDMDLAIATAREQGYDPGPAIAMQRQRPDGMVLNWTLTFAPSISVPFLIHWETPFHPGRDAAPGLELVEFRARHPRPSVLAKILEALGVTMGIERGDEALLVELSGPRGSIWFN